MASDQNKKTLRAFQCREYLWEVFERMSAELDCSVDYLINESMRQYARTRGVRTSRVSLGPSFSAPPVDAPKETPTAPPPRGDSRPPMHAAIPAAPAAPTFEAPPASAPPAMPAANAPLAAAAAAPVAPPLVSPGLAPPPLPSMPPPPTSAQAQPARPPLFIIYNGQKFPVDKDEFVIGRGSKSSDFTIKDGNISRRHALVVFQNGHYYMKDLGSTNGIDFAGQRVGTKLIDEGDVFRICDYELRFTYR